MLRRGRRGGQTTESTTGKQLVVVASPEVHCNSNFTLLLSDSYGRRSGFKFRRALSKLDRGTVLACSVVSGEGSVVKNGSGGVVLI